MQGKSKIAFEFDEAMSFGGVARARFSAEYLNKIYNADKNLFNHLKNKLREFYLSFKKMSKKYENFGYLSQSAASYEVSQLSKKSLKKIANIYAEALKVAAGEYQNVELKKTELKAEKNTADSGVKYQLRAGAKADVKKVLNNKSYTEDVYLTENSPSIIASQKGVKNLPMLMKASHIRENIFSEEEAVKKGLKVNKNINYHGLGEELFLKIINGLDGVNRAYRGTSNAEDSSRRENYFLLISQYKDANGNMINVPVYINEKGQYNRVFIDTNKIATAFGRPDLNNFIKREISNGNLVAIKNRSAKVGELTSAINASYGDNTSIDTKIPQDNSVVNSNSMQNSENNAKELHSDRDSHYLDLAKDPEKNKAELQKMVDEAAKEAG